MGSKPNRPLALLAAALLGLCLAGCNFGRNVADDCWTNAGDFESAELFRGGLRLRNLPARKGAWAASDSRVGRSRQALRACEDGAPGLGRPPVGELSFGEERGHAPAPGDHGA